MSIAPLPRLAARQRQVFFIDYRDAAAPRQIIHNGAAAAAVHFFNHRGSSAARFFARIQSVMLKNFQLQS
jgi:hypothetical protein